MKADSASANDPIPYVPMYNGSDRNKALQKALKSTFASVAAGTYTIGIAVLSRYIPPSDLAPLVGAGIVIGVSGGLATLEVKDDWKNYRRINEEYQRDREAGHTL